MVALFSSIGWQEMALLFFLGLLLYGRNLPDAGRKFGRVVAQLRRSFQDFKDQIDRDGEVRSVKQVISNTAREVKNVAKAPSEITNPLNALRELTHDAMSTPTHSAVGDGVSERVIDDGDEDMVIETDEPEAEAPTTHAPPSEDPNNE